MSEWVSEWVREHRVDMHFGRMDLRVSISQLSPYIHVYIIYKQYIRLEALLH